MYEHLSGRYTIKQIFNDNWNRFYLEHKDNIRHSINWNIEKVLACKDIDQLGFNTYTCPKCDKKKFVPHTCKSRFCNSCGKVATDSWINETLKRLINCDYRHLVFSPPSELWPIFLTNRSALSLLFHSAAYAFLEYCVKEYNIIPGIVVILHTFGATLNFHPHIHILITCGGLDIHNQKWKKVTYFHHDALKERFKYNLIKSLRLSAQSKELSIHESIKKYWKVKFKISSFYQLTQKLYDMKWYVWIGERFTNANAVTHYIGRYAKRPCISETKINDYDGQSITFSYKDKIEKLIKTTTIPIDEFIGRLIRHIPEKQFRMIRYYGLFSNRTRNLNFQRIIKIIPILINQFIHQALDLPRTWRERIIYMFKKDPLMCPVCKCEMILSSVTYRLRDGTFNTLIL